VSFRLLAVTLLSFASLAGADQLLLLNGTVSGKAPVKAIAEDGTITFGSKQISLQDVRRIDRDGIETDALPLRATRLFLNDGSIIIAEKLKIDSETVTFDMDEAQAVSIPLTSLRGVVLMPLSADEGGRLAPDPTYAQTLGDLTDREDTLFVIKDGSIITVRGALEAFGAEDATFIWNDKSRKISLDKLYGITVAAPAVPPTVVGQARVHLKGGSTLWGSPVLSGGELSVERPDGLHITIPWDRVVRLDVSSTRMAFLSDLKPTSVDNRPIAATPHQPTMDRSVSMGALRLGEQTFERGIGVHAPTEMTWQIDGAYDLLAMIVGIDESMGRQGDCVVKVIADGRELFAKRITGGGEPVAVNLKVTGVDRLTLAAEAGNGLDLGDHVNFADARLIKE
jgi:hypothetical protein